MENKDIYITKEELETINRMYTLIKTHREDFAQDEFDVTINDVDAMNLKDMYNRFKDIAE